jgi:SAM-dependent methyltransferase
VSRSEVDGSPYGDAFFETQLRQSRSSAAAAAPILVDLLEPRSVLDVGCGVGAWAEAMSAAGVPEVVGVDGSYVGSERLLIPEDRFLRRDLVEPFDLGSRFDLVVCLEVAEHLPPQRAASFVRDLCRHSDLIVFSAAVPGQGGTNHLNEQWPSYWIRLFAGCGYGVFDVLRPRLWDDRRIGFWYRQNMIALAADAAAERVAGLPPAPPIVDYVHPAQFELKVELLATAFQDVGVRFAGRTFAGAVRSYVARALDR